MSARIVGLPVSFKKPHKYLAKRTVYNGVSYASKAEAARAAELDLLVKAGEVLLWIGQPKFRLGCPENIYIADFLVWEKDRLVHVEDVKGVATAKFRRDKRLWAKYGPCQLWIIARHNLCIQSIVPGCRGIFH